MDKRRIIYFLKINRKLVPSAATLLFAAILLIVATFFEEIFIKFVSITTFLSWHSLFEIGAIIGYVAIYMLTYYTYQQSKKLRLFLLSNFLLTAGILHAFHMLSYKGMPSFFAENTSANRATTLWIAARIIYALGFLVSVFVKEEIKSTVNRNYFMMISLSVSIGIFIVSTYYPSFLPAMFVEGYGLTLVKKLLEYFIMLILFIASLATLHEYVKKREKDHFMLFCALFLSVLSEFSFTIYINVYGIYNYFGHILMCVSLFMVFKVIFTKNILAPYLALSGAQKALKGYADNLDKIVEQRTKQLKMINGRLYENLEYARDIQKSLLPGFLPDTSEIGFNALYLSAERLSGDFYDVFKLDEDHIGFYISDVSGHGVPAAMLTVFLKQCVDSVVETDRIKGSISSPSAILQHIYDAFNHSNFRDEVYIVLIYFIYNTKERRLVYSSAGMNEAPVFIDREGNVKEISIKGFPICKLIDVYSVTYYDSECVMNQGDRLYLYTDGLVETRNSSDQQYLSERLKQQLKQSKDKKLAEQVSIIKDDLLFYADGNKFNDDVTLLAIEFR